MATSNTVDLQFVLTIDLANAAKSSGSLEAEVSEQLSAFEHGSFSLEDEISGLDERGIHDLREQLAFTKRECTEKIKRLLHQHYPAFISASKVGLHQKKRKLKDNVQEHLNQCCCLCWQTQISRNLGSDLAYNLDRHMNATSIAAVTG